MQIEAEVERWDSIIQNLYPFLLSDRRDLIRDSGTALCVCEPQKVSQLHCGIRSRGQMYGRPEEGPSLVRKSWRNAKNSCPPEASA